MCDLDLGRNNPIVVLCTFSYNGDHLWKHFQRFKSYGADTKCRLLIMKWRLFNIWPLSVTLTLGVATLFLRSAHHLIMVITCAKLFQTRAVTERDKCPRKILIINHLLHVKCFGKNDKVRTSAVTFKLDKETVVLFTTHCPSMVTLYF
jgi:hypothetical protein